MRSALSFAHGIGNNGCGDFTKTGAGALTLAGLNTYMGQTTVTEGTLNIPTGGDITASSGVTLAGGTINVQTGGNAPAQSAWTWATNVALASSQNVSLVGQTFTLVASVSVPSPGQNAPTGSVDFYDETTSTDLGTVAVDQSGNAALSIAISNVEDDQITATYTPDGGSSQLLSSASAPFDQEVVAPATVEIGADKPVAEGASAGEFTVGRNGGDINRPLAVSLYLTTGIYGAFGVDFTVSGSGLTYHGLNEGCYDYTLTIPAGAGTATIDIVPTTGGGSSEVYMSLSEAGPGYTSNIDYLGAQVDVLQSPAPATTPGGTEQIYDVAGMPFGPFNAGEFLPMVVTTGASIGGGTYDLSYDSDFKVTYDEGGQNVVSTLAANGFYTLYLWAVPNSSPPLSSDVGLYYNGYSLGDVPVDWQPATITMSADPGSSEGQELRNNGDNGTPGAAPLPDGSWGRVDGATTTVVVGQYIDLAINGALAPWDTYQWTINGQPIKSYTQSLQAAVVTPLSGNDPCLAGPEVEFYWTAPGTYTAKCTVTVDGNAMPLTATFIVKAPTSSFKYVFTIDTPAVNVVPSTGVLCLGDLSWPGYGIKFVGSVTNNDTREGTIGVVQTAYEYRTRTYATTGVTLTKRSTGALPVVDNSSTGYYFMNRLEPVTPGVEMVFTSGVANPPNTILTPWSDNPMLGPDGATSLSVSESFNTNLMYLPAGLDSIYVNLQLIVWGWSGSTTCKNGVWSNPNTGDPWSSASNWAIGGTQDSTLPTWSGSLKELPWSAI